MVPSSSTPSSSVGTASAGDRNRPGSVLQSRRRYAVDHDGSLQELLRWKGRPVHSRVEKSQVARGGRSGCIWTRDAKQLAPGGFLQMFSMSESPAAAKRRGFRIIGGFEREIACSGSIAHASIPSRQAPQSTELSFFAICQGQRRRED